jgi:hypothetical protein
MIQPAFQSQSWTESSKLGLTVDAPWMVTPFSSLTLRGHGPREVASEDAAFDDFLR